MRGYQWKRQRVDRRSHRRAERTGRRRQSALKFTAGLLLAGLVCLAAYVALIEPRMVKVSRHEIALEDLPWAFDGFTIVQLSDFHIGLWSRPAGVQRLVSRVNALDADLIVLTGDYVNKFRGNVEPAGRALRGLTARCGVYAVLGNHDYWVDAEGMTDALRESGIDVLFDEKREISLEGARVWLVGVDDIWEGDPDYDKALDGVRPEDTCIVLAHSPDAILALDGRPVDLVLSGHTHGGQVNLPIVGPLYAPTALGPKYAAGSFRFGKTQLYISRGLGFQTPIRFRCPPEIPVFTLRRGNR